MLIHYTTIFYENSQALLEKRILLTYKEKYANIGYRSLSAASKFTVNLNFAAAVISNQVCRWGGMNGGDGKFGVYIYISFT